VVVAAVLAACSSAMPAAAPSDASKKPGRAEDLLIVDCLLPGQIRQLGTQATILTARRATKIPASECAIRGGEYVAYDRANLETSLKVWRPMAESGDALAQTYVGEIYEKGLGVPPDYTEAAKWYRRAAEHGSARAASNLGYLYEQGLGVQKDPAEAVAWYRRATGSTATPFAIEKPAPAAVPVPSPAAAETPARQRSDAPPASASDVARTAAPPPTIEITEPELSVRNGAAAEIRVQPPIDRVTVAGRISSPAGLKTTTVNGAEQPVDAEQRFRTQVAIRQPEERVTIAAVDRAGRSTTTSFVVRSRRPVATGSSRMNTLIGSYHALVVGNEDYRALPRLTSAVADARLVAKTLTDDYRFKVTVLTDASRYDILLALNGLRQRLTDKDNLLIYYAGHARRSGDGQQDAWIPVDADASTPAGWISQAAITEFLSAMTVRQVLLTTDSCYASGVSRPGGVAPDWDDEQTRQVMIETLSKRKARMLLTSGSCDASPAATTAGQPTAFTRSLVEILDANRDVLAGQEVFRLLRLRMAAVDRPDATRTLAYAPIRYAGHEAGDFFFVRPDRLAAWADTGSGRDGVRAR
jgi:Caspase domain/Sel1 repeat